MPQIRCPLGRLEKQQKSAVYYCAGFFSGITQE